jgi:hypothetical protein
LRDFASVGRRRFVRDGSGREVFMMIYDHGVWTFWDKDLGGFCSGRIVL